MYVFLDFDGVLRRASSARSRFEKDCLDAFETAIRSLPDARIVITSTWRLGIPLEQLRSLFSADVAQRIVGATPDLVEDETHARYKEIQLYLRKRNAEGESWIAIDDQPEHFPQHAPVLITDSDEGFDSACAARLLQLAAKVRR
jgi:hypothetical protein